MASSGPTEDEKWLVVDGRRWRRTDPAIPEDALSRLKSHLGRGRSGVRTAQDDAALEATRSPSSTPWTTDPVSRTCPR